MIKFVNNKDLTDQKLTRRKMNQISQTYFIGWVNMGWTDSVISSICDTIGISMSQVSRV